MRSTVSMNEMVPPRRATVRGLDAYVGGDVFDYSGLDVARFLTRTRKDPESGCWLWAGARDGDGYGIFTPRHTGKAARAHRWYFQVVSGPLDPALCLDHFACDNPPCVNPDHLRPVTTRENILRGNTIQAWNLAKTHCKHGHEFNTENTGYRKTGQRICRPCQARQQRAFRARKKSA